MLLQFFKKTHSIVKLKLFLPANQVNIFISNESFVALLILPPQPTGLIHKYPIHLSLKVLRFAF